MNTSFYSQEELKELGLKRYGKDVLISRKVSIYCPERISLGNNVRIDDFCILSGSITLGSNIHISAYCALYGSHGIVIDDFSGMSARSTIYSAMDDFSGDYLIGPIHPEVMTNVQGGLVHLEKYVQLGVGSVVFPDLTLAEGCIVGAMSLVNRPLDAWTVNVGIPTKKLKDRKRTLLSLVENYYGEK